VARTDAAAAINSQQSADVTYGVDPRGWRMAAALAGVHNRTLTGAPAVIDTSKTDHDGWVRPLQQLRGLAPLILGSGRAMASRSSELGDEPSDSHLLDNAAERILAERWKRQGGGPSW
jgi:hypothetical protein